MTLFGNKELIFVNKEKFINISSPYISRNFFIFINKTDDDVKLLQKMKLASEKLKAKKDEEYIFGL